MDYNHFHVLTKCLYWIYLVILLAFLSEGFYSGCRESTRNGECCVFPFIYKNKVYYECSKLDNPVEWCATTEHFTTVQKWGNCSGQRRVFPLNEKYKNLEMDGTEPHPRINGTTLAEGPWGRKNWSQQLNKSSNSYIKFLVYERETVNDFTILAWLYIASPDSPQASKPGTWGLIMGLAFKDLAYMTLRFVPRPLPSGRALTYDGLEKNSWYFVGITFDQKKELSTLWVNDQPVASVKNSIYDLVYSKRLLWLGSKVDNSDSPHLTMRLSCVQFFTSTLTREAMARTKFVCRDETLRICEKNSAKIICAAPRKKIHVHAANFGFSWGTKVCQGISYRSTCVDENSLALVRRHCEGEQTCVLKAQAGSWFGFTDQCKGKLKYLEVQYACQPALPLAPTLRMVTGVTADSALLLWESPNRGGADILQYNIQVYGFKFYVVIVSQGNTTYLKLENLQHKKQYFVTIRAVSSVGIGPPSAVREFNTLEGVTTVKPTTNVLINRTTTRPRNSTSGERSQSSVQDDVRVKMFPYIIALLAVLAVVVILLLAKLVVDYCRKRRQVKDRSETVPTIPVVQLNEEAIHYRKYQEIDHCLNLEDLRERASYYSADFKELTESDHEGSVYEEIKHDHDCYEKPGDEMKKDDRDNVYLEVIA